MLSPQAAAGKNSPALAVNGTRRRSPFPRDGQSGFEALLTTSGPVRSAIDHVETGFGGFFSAFGKRQEIFQRRAMRALGAVALLPPRLSCPRSVNLADDGITEVSPSSRAISDADHHRPKALLSLAIRSGVHEAFSAYGAKAINRSALGDGFARHTHFVGDIREGATIGEAWRTSAWRARVQVVRLIPRLPTPYGAPNALGVHPSHTELGRSFPQPPTEGAHDPPRRREDAPTAPPGGNSPSHFRSLSQSAAMGSSPTTGVMTLSMKSQP